MKIKTVIKADFYINPENYGYYAHDDLPAIWREIIKPLIAEIDTTARSIDNSSINEWIISYRKTFRELNG
jgi:hypothetical protein